MEWGSSHGQAFERLSERQLDDLARGMVRDLGVLPFAKLLTPKEAGEVLGVKPSTLAHWRVAGYGPPFRALGRKTVRYHPFDLMAYVTVRSCEHTGRRSKTGAPIAYESAGIWAKAHAAPWDKSLRVRKNVALRAFRQWHQEQYNEPVDEYWFKSSSLTRELMRYGVTHRNDFYHGLNIENPEKFSVLVWEEQERERQEKAERIANVLREMIRGEPVKL